MSKPETKEKKFDKRRAAMVVHKLPKAQGVVMHHILAAVVYGSLNHQRRIETYGRLNKQILCGIGKDRAHDGTTSEAAKCKKRNK